MKAKKVITNQISGYHEPFMITIVGYANFFVVRGYIRYAYCCKSIVEVLNLKK